MRWTLGIMTPALALAGSGTGAVRAERVDARAPGWLAGCWEQVTRQGWTQECWTDARGGTMLGSGRSGTGDRVSAWEAMQILPEPDGRPAFWASPGGGVRVRFPMVSQAPGEIVFANPAHDYPQRIRYRLEGRGITAETSLLDGARPIRWTYERTQ